MIVCKSQNFAFFRAPKTGSTTTTFLLRLGRVWPEDAIMSYTPYGEFPPQNFVHPIIYRRDADGRQMLDHQPVYPFPYFAHTTPTQIIDGGLITANELKAMNAYSFMRHPMERILSAAIHIIGRHANPKTVQNMLTGQFRERQPHKLRRSLGMVSIPQADYLYYNGEQVVTPLLTKPFRPAVDLVCEKAGIPRYAHMPRLNARPAWKTVFSADDFWTDEILEGYRVAFAEDWRIYDELKATGTFTPNPDYEVSNPDLHTRGLGPRGFAMSQERRLMEEAEKEIRGKEFPQRRAG
jgi:hypothetical protein